MRSYPFLLLIFLTSLFASHWIYVRNLAASEPTQFILAWDPNAEADLNGYGIYYKDQVENTPYLFLGDVYVDELADRTAPMVTSSMPITLWKRILSYSQSKWLNW